jgi:hypothetical protein
MLTLYPAARTALKRKKNYEQSLEQTSNQITILENQISSIESANINQETLVAMQNAGKAMKDIHGNLTIDKVDRIMYVLIIEFRFYESDLLTYSIGQGGACRSGSGCEGSCERYCERSGGREQLRYRRTGRRTSRIRTRSYG